MRGEAHLIVNDPRSLVGVLSVCGSKCCGCTVLSHPRLGFTGAKASSARVYIPPSVHKLDRWFALFHFSKVLFNSFGILADQVLLVCHGCSGRNRAGEASRASIWGKGRSDHTTTIRELDDRSTFCLWRAWGQMSFISLSTIRSHHPIFERTYLIPSRKP